MSEVTASLQAKALRLLAQRDHSRQELARKLSQQSEVSTEQVECLLIELTQLGYLDDGRFAELLVRSALARGCGPKKLEQQAREKGVDMSLLATALALAEPDWLAIAKAQRAKKFGDVLPQQFKERARQSRFLAGRGFYIETINAVFHEKC